MRRRRRRTGGKGEIIENCGAAGAVREKGWKHAVAGAAHCPFHNTSLEAVCQATTPCSNRWYCVNVHQESIIQIAGNMFCTRQHRGRRRGLLLVYARRGNRARCTRGEGCRTEIELANIITTIVIHPSAIDIGYTCSLCRDKGTVNPILLRVARLQTMLRPYPCRGNSWPRVHVSPAKH
eukprot:gene24380-biopygen8938